MATEINAGRVAMVPKGEWSASTAYVRLDVVQHGGSAWVCIQDGTGQEPASGSTYWQLLAAGIKATDYYTKPQVDTALQAKQDALVSGQNIKSINGQSVLGDGNLELGELFVVRMTQKNSVCTADKSVSEIYEASYTNGKPVIAIMRDISNPVFILTDCNPDGDSYVFSSIESNTVTTLRWQRSDDYTYELETIVLQPHLVSGTNIKTVNGQSVLGAGNLELGELFVVRMTQKYSVCTADKSVSEIYEASYTNGKPVIAIMRDISNPVFILTDCNPDGDSYVFSSIESNTVTTLRWQRNDDYTYELETIVLQPHLVSGTNIKTVNNESLLGGGNVDIVGKSAYQSYVDTTTDSPVKTEAEWVASLKGEDGVSLGEVAIADNLTTDDATKVLSAKQGYLLGQKVNDVDDVPTTGSEKFVKSGGVVKHNIDTAFVGDVKKAIQFAGFLSSDKIETYRSATFSVIKVNGGDSLEVDNTNGASCFFVKSFDFGFTLPYTPDLCSGETGRRVLADTTLPADAEYIIIQHYASNGSNVLPKKLVIGGIDYTVSNDVYEALSKGHAATKELGLDNIYIHKAYIDSNGEVQPSSNHWYCSDLIPLSKIFGDTLELEYSTNGDISSQKYAWAFYDEQENYVSGSLIGAKRIKINNLDAGVVYIRLSSYNRQENRILNYSERTIDASFAQKISYATTKIDSFVGKEVALDNVLDYSAYDDNGSWILSNGRYKGIIVKCNPNKKYILTNNTNANGMYSFLKSDSTDTVDYCTGTQRNQISANSTLEFTTPQDANYIWLATQYGAIECNSSLTLVGEKDALVAPLYDEVNFMEDAANGIENADKYYGWLDGNSASIVRYLSAKYCRINISGKKKLRIVTNTFGYVEITKDFEAKNVPPAISLALATGETGKRKLSENSITEITIPNDAVYAVFQYTMDNGDIIIPLSICVDGFEFVNSAKYNPYPSNNTYIEQKEIDNLHSSLGSHASEAFTFIHTSDTHLKNGNSKCLENIMSLLNDDYINCLVHTGDIVWDNFPNNDTSKQGYDIFANLVNNATKDVIFTVGNHDVGGEYKNTAICGTDVQVYNTFYAPFMKSNFVSEGEGKCSYYVDYADKKVRFISLYQYNSDYEMSGSELKDIRGRQAWRQAEIDWFCTTLNSTPEGYAVFVLTHEVETLGDKTNDWQSIIIAGHETSTNNHLLTDIVTAFVNRTTVNTSLTQSVGVIGTITANYDFVNAKGYFAAFLNGHLHDDFVGKEKNSDLNVINKCCDNMLYQAGCTTRHIPDTYNENTINVVTVYPNRRLIKVMRIGAKYSSEGDYRNVTWMRF